jgi:hypothetical protein
MPPCRPLRPRRSGHLARYQEGGRANVIWPKDFGTLIHARLDSILGDNGSVAEGEMVMLPEGREVPLASIIDPALDVIHELNLEFPINGAHPDVPLGYAGTSDVLAMKDGLPSYLWTIKPKRPQEGEPIVIPTLRIKCRLPPIGMRRTPLA